MPDTYYEQVRSISTTSSTVLFLSGTSLPAYPISETSSWHGCEPHLLKWRKISGSPGLCPVTFSQSFVPLLFLLFSWSGVDVGGQRCACVCVCGEDALTTLLPNPLSLCPFVTFIRQNPNTGSTQFCLLEASPWAAGGNVPEHASVCCVQPQVTPPSFLCPSELAFPCTRASASDLPLLKLFWSPWGCQQMFLISSLAEKTEALRRERYHILALSMLKRCPALISAGHPQGTRDSVPCSLSKPHTLGFLLTLLPLLRPNAFPLLLLKHSLVFLSQTAVRTLTLSPLLSIASSPQQFSVSLTTKQQTWNSS